ASGPRDSVPDELYVRELYLRGRHAELSRSLVGMQTAKEYYRGAIERDSTFAPGYAGLAEVYELMAFYDFAPVTAALDSAHIMARRAVASDSTLPEAHIAVGLSLADAHDFDAAEREFKRAIEFGPSNAQAHYWYSMLLVALGRGKEALREAERGLELDPFSPRAARPMQFGGKDSAVVWLGRQQTWTMIHLAFLSVDRFMDPLRSDPRFIQLLRHLGIRT